MSEPFIHKPGNKTPIDKLYAWLSVDEKGNEGIMASTELGGAAMVTGSKALANGMMKLLVEAIPKQEGYEIVLAEFERKK